MEQLPENKRRFHNFSNILWAICQENNLDMLPKGLSKKNTIFLNMTLHDINQQYHQFPADLVQSLRADIICPLFNDFYISADTMLMRVITLKYAQDGPWILRILQYECLSNNTTETVQGVFDNIELPANTTIYNNKKWILRTDALLSKKGSKIDVVSFIKFSDALNSFSRKMFNFQDKTDFLYPMIQELQAQERICLKYDDNRRLDEDTATIVPFVKAMSIIFYYISQNASKPSLSSATSDETQGKRKTDDNTEYTKTVDPQPKEVTVKKYGPVTIKISDNTDTGCEVKGFTYITPSWYRQGHKRRLRNGKVAYIQPGICHRRCIKNNKSDPAVVRMYIKGVTK